MTTLNEDLARMLATLQHHLAENMSIVDGDIQIEIGFNEALVIEPMYTPMGLRWVATACAWAPDHGLDEAVELWSTTEQCLPKDVRNWLNEQDEMNRKFEEMTRDI